MSYILCPSGNLFSFGRIGGNKAFDGGYVILGNGADEVLSYFECPNEVALAWRDAFNDVLINHQRDRRPPQIDWWAIAGEIDPDWASKHGWQTPVSSGAAAAQPVRRAQIVSPDEL